MDYQGILSQKIHATSNWVTSWFKSKNLEAVLITKILNHLIDSWLKLSSNRKVI